VAEDIVTRLRDVTVLSWDGDEITDELAEEAAAKIERLQEELNTTQELLARCYKLAVGHGPNFDVFDTWEEAVSAYERETNRDNP
jgi:hypothetical protein